MSPVKKPFAIKPVEFGLPRPRFLDNPQFNSDPPLPVLDPLLSWAKDAHWSIEGKISKLRAETPTKRKKIFGSESPPKAPTMYKRKSFLNLNEEDEIRRNLCDDFDRVAGDLKTNSIASVIAVKRLRTSPRLAKKPRSS